MNTYIAPTDRKEPVVMPICLDLNLGPNSWWSKALFFYFTSLYFVHLPPCSSAIERDVFATMVSLKRPQLVIPDKLPDAYNQWISQSTISATGFTMSSLTHVYKTIYQFTGITKTNCMIWLFQFAMFCCIFYDKLKLFSVFEIRANQLYNFLLHTYVQDNLSVYRDHDRK